MSDQHRPPGASSGASFGSAHPDLVALLRYELSNAEAAAAGEHLDVCEECRSDLGDLVVGSSVMGRAARTLGASAAPDAADLPPLSLPRRADRPPAPRRPWLLAVAAIVAVGAIGGLGAVAAGLVNGEDPASPAGPEQLQAAPVQPTPLAPTRSVELAPAPGGSLGRASSGTVDLVEGDSTTMLTFATTALPQTRVDEFYEAWLLDPATDKMLPLGVVSEGDETTFAVSNDLLDSYAALDLSLEADDGDPRHSARSVLRGTY